MPRLIDRNACCPLIVVLALATVILPPHHSFAGDRSLHFAGEMVGGAPADFEPTSTSAAGADQWRIVADENAREGKALGQLARGTSRDRFPLAIYRSVEAADVEMVAWLSVIGGVADRTAGVVVRFLDARNYYAAGLDSLAHRIHFYRVIDGDHQRLAAADVRMSPGEYNNLALRAAGDTFKVAFNGRDVLAVTDATFRGAGKVGLWSKGDSVPYFDWIVIRPLDAQ
jgi:hypothetical protein